MRVAGVANTTRDLKTLVSVVALAAWRPRKPLVSVPSDSLPRSAGEVPGQQQVRLTPVRVDDLVSRYRAGASTRDLAAVFGVHRTTVVSHLERCGVPRRAHVRKLSDQQIRDASGEYLAGDSLKTLGERYGVDAATIRTHLVRAGVQLRPRRGWEATNR